MSDTTLWMVHIQGPDDVVGAPSKDDAAKVAAAFNKIHGESLIRTRAETAAAGGDPDNWPTVVAVVAEWDSTPAAHDNSVKKYWPEYAWYLAIQFDAASKAELEHIDRAEAVARAIYKWSDTGPLEAEEAHTYG